MRVAIVFAAALHLARPAAAGIVYDFVTTIEAPRNATRVAGRVWVDGSSYRAELAPDPNRAVDVVISTDADRSAIYLDVDKHSWVERKRINADVRSSSLFRWPLPGGHVTGKPEIEHRVEETTELAGQRATLHVVTIRFRLESLIEKERVGGTIEATARMWIANELRSLPMDRQIRTGYREVDRELEPIFSGMTGMILRHELEVTRTMDGGPPQKELTKTIVNNLTIMDVPPGKFEVPSEYAYAGTKAP